MTAKLPKPVTSGLIAKESIIFHLTEPEYENNLLLPSGRILIYIPGSVDFLSTGGF